MRSHTAIALAASAFLLWGCGKEAPSPAPKTALPIKAEPASKPPVWPFLSQGAEANDASTGMPQMTRNYYVVLDASASMSISQCSGKEAKMPVAKRALLTFAKSVPHDANLGLQVFDGKGIREIQPLGLVDSVRFARHVQGITPGGGTPLQDSIRAAYHALTAQARRQLGYGEYHLIVVTDGEANAGQDPMETVNRLLSESPVVLHTIGFCLGEKHSLNQPGRTLYRAANDPRELEQRLSDVLAEAPSFAVSRFK